MEAARITFTDETAVHLGGKEVRAYYFGRGHTNGDAIIYFPALRTLHTGDMMAGTTPLIDYPGGGSLAGPQNPDQPGTSAWMPNSLTMILASPRMTVEFSVIKMLEDFGSDGFDSLLAVVARALLLCFSIKLVSRRAPSENM